MLNGTMKGNRVKVTTPEFQFSWHLRIIWELNVDNIVVLKLHSWATCGDGMLFFIKNTLRVGIRCLEVVMFRPHIVLLFSHLTDTKCFLLVCVVATTRPMSNSSTTSKSQGRYLVGNMSYVIHKRTRQRTITVFY